MCWAFCPEGCSDKSSAEVQKDVFAFLDWLGGLPCNRRKSGSTVETCHSWNHGGWDQWLSCPPGVFHYLTEKPFLCIWIWGAVFVQVSVGKTCTLNLSMFMDMRRFHLSVRIGSCLQLSVLCFSWMLKLSYCWQGQETALLSLKCLT